MLLERGKRGAMAGFTDNYIRVEFPSTLQEKGSRVQAMDNCIVQARLTGWNDKGDALIGEIV